MSRAQLGLGQRKTEPQVWIARASPFPISCRQAYLSQAYLGQAYLGQAKYNIYLSIYFAEPEGRAPSLECDGICSDKRANAGWVRLSASLNR